MKNVLGLAVAAAVMWTGAAAAQTCGGTYTVQQGDSLSVIADELYKDAGKWTAIHTQNITAIGENPNAIRVGQKLTLSCIAGLPTGLPGGKTVLAVQESQQTAPEPAVAETAETTRTETDLLGTAEKPRITLVTGDDFAPFTDRGLMENGLLAEVVTTAMTAAVGPDGFETFWINDWPAHVDTILPAGLIEITYPWAKPDCEVMPDHERCVSYMFSDPMFEYLVLLFVDKSRPLPFASNADIEGRTLCRPAGYTTHMLDQDGRNWLAEDKITLKQPVQVNQCFEMLLEGEVDGVVLNEFTARDALRAMDITDKVDAVQSRPVAIAGLHALVHKSHPQAERLVATVNDGLRAIKADGQYQDIVGRHMEQIWAGY